MVLHRYFKRERSACPAKVPSLSEEEIHQVNKCVKHAMEQGEPFRMREVQRVHTRGKGDDGGKYAAENGPAKTIRHFSDRKIPETTARRLKSEYLLVMKAQINESKKDGTVPQVSSLSKKPQGRPLLLGQELDKSVQDYINAMRKVGGVVNTAIVIAAANGIVAARSPALLTQHGGHIDITKAWAKSLLKCWENVCGTF